MARHEVRFTVPQRPLGKADVEFDIKRNGEALGRLKVSKALSVNNIYLRARGRIA